MLCVVNNCRGTAKICCTKLCNIETELPSFSCLCHCTAEPNVGNGHDHDTYAWTQTLGDVSLSVPVPDGTKGRSCDVSITRNRLKVPAGRCGACAPGFAARGHMNVNETSETAGAGSLPAWPLRWS